MGLWSLKGRPILVVDDFPEMRSMLRAMVAAYGADQVDQARNGAEAIEKLERRRYNIVLCDYNLGQGKDGQQVLEEAKHRNILPYSSVFIMVTAENTSGMVMGALEYQPDAYLAKPVTKTVLQARLLKLLEKKESFRGICRALTAGDRVQAIRECDALLEAGSRYRFELCKLKADLLIETGDYDRAEALLQAVLEERELPWAALGLGKIHYFRKDYGAAAALFEGIVQANPNFVAAYDWLARVQADTGRTEEAQQSLLAAVQCSPKSVPRQRALGEVAERNGEQDLCEQARRRVVSIGRGSVLRRPDDHSALARTLVERGAAREALKVVDNMRHEFKDDPAADFEAAVMGARVHGALGQGERAAESLDKALAALRERPDLVSETAATELLAQCLEADRAEDADQVLRGLIRNGHEDEGLMDRVGDIYRAAGQGERVEALIAAAAEEVAEINNRGVRLAQAGELEASSRHFAEAVREMPGNPVVNLNAAQSLIMLMKERGVTEEGLAEAMGYIRAAERAPHHSQWANKLRNICQSMARRAKAG